MSTKSVTILIIYKGRTADNLDLRLPEAPRKRFNLATVNNHSSMNGEMIVRVDGELDLDEECVEIRGFY